MQSEAKEPNFRLVSSPFTCFHHQDITRRTRPLAFDFAATGLVLSAPQGASGPNSLPTRNASWLFGFLACWPFLATTLAPSPPSLSQPLSSNAVEPGPASDRLASIALWLAPQPEHAEADRLMRPSSRAPKKNPTNLTPVSPPAYERAIHVEPSPCYPSLPLPKITLTNVPCCDIAPTPLNDQEQNIVAFCIAVFYR